MLLRGDIVEDNELVMIYFQDILDDIRELKRATYFTTK